MGTPQVSPRKNPLPSSPTEGSEEDFNSRLGEGFSLPNFPDFFREVCQVFIQEASQLTHTFSREDLSTAQKSAKIAGFIIFSLAALTQFYLAGSFVLKNLGKIFLSLAFMYGAGKLLIEAESMDSPWIQHINSLLGKLQAVLERIGLKKRAEELP